MEKPRFLHDLTDAEFTEEVGRTKPNTPHALVIQAELQRRQATAATSAALSSARSANWVMASVVVLAISTFGTLALDIYKTFFVKSPPVAQSPSTK